MRQAMGVAVFFGMIGVTVFGLILTPILYVVVRRPRVRTGESPGTPVPACQSSSHASG